MGKDLDDVFLSGGAAALDAAIANARLIPAKKKAPDPLKAISKIEIEGGSPLAARFKFKSISGIKKPNLNTFHKIHGLMPRVGVQMIYGPSTIGKTFVVIDAMLHVATGKPYNGRRTEKSLVVCFTGEGHEMFENRLFAAREALGISPDEELPFVYVCDMPGLAKNDIDTKAAIADIEELRKDARFKDLPIVVVVDTVSTAMQGEREDEVGFGTLITNAYKIVKHFATALVVLIHHTGKNTDNGARGSSVIFANLDGVWLILGDESETGGTVLVEKFREGRRFLTWGFRRNEINLGLNPYGDDVTTCTITLTGEPKLAKKKAEGERGLGDVAFDDAVSEVMHQHGFEYRVDGDARVKVKAVALAHVRAEFGRRYATGKDGKDRAANTISNAYTRALNACHYRYALRAVEITKDADLDKYKVTKKQLPRHAKKDDADDNKIEIIWFKKHQPEVAHSFRGGDE